MTTKSYTLAEIAKYVSGELKGDPQRVVTGIMSIVKANQDHITFHVGATYDSYLSTTQAAVILSADAQALCQSDVIICESPYLAYAKVAHMFMPDSVMDEGTHPSAQIDPSASIDKSCKIGANVVIGPDVVVREGCTIEAGTVIAGHCQIGKGCQLMANVTLYRDCLIDDEVTIHSGAVIGSEGFGHAEDANQHWVLIPQLGRVVIGRKAEIGANTTIDRGALDDTVIGEGVVIDNLVQIAHNVVIGDHTAIAACVGISGSVTIGKHCKIAGQVGIVGHLTITDHVILLARCVVTKSITKPGVYSGSIGCQERREWNKNAVIFRQLHKFFARLKTEETA